MTSHPLLTSSGGQRGSALLIVLALLSVLALLALTLTYTSRLEVISARNFAEASQRNESALTGIQEAARVANERLPVEAISDFYLLYGLANPDFVNKSGAEKEAVRVAAAEATLPRRITAKDTQIGGVDIGLRTDTTHVTFADASARVNINTIDEEALALFLFELSANSGVAIDAFRLASDIVERRLGPDGAPGVAGEDDNINFLQSLDNVTLTPCPIPGGPFSPNTLAGATDPTDRLENSCFGLTPERQGLIDALLTAVDEPEEYIADIRFDSFGDDRRWSRLAELLKLDSMTPEFFEVAQNYLTTFSVTQQVRPNPADPDTPLSPVDLNRACFDEIYEALALEYGGTKNDNLLRQFAANIVDARDGDRRPTEVLNSEGTGRILGVERTPFIIEVDYDSPTPDGDGDDGQFVEIYNPWPESFNLAGWRLRVGFTVYTLGGTLGPNSYLIVTDDFDDSLDADGFSFYDTYGLVSNGGTRRILEIPGFDLPNGPAGARVQLIELTGDLVDEFRYRAQPAPLTSSFQRRVPFVRDVILAPATPFTRLPLNAPDPEIQDKIFYTPQDTPFTSVLELFEVSAGFTGPNGEERKAVAFPRLVSPASLSTPARDLAADPEVIDARIVDLFTVAVAGRPDFVATKGLGAPDFKETALKADRDPEALAWYEYAPPPLGYAHGRINVNSADRFALFAAGLNFTQADLIIERRRQEGLRALQNFPDADGIVWERLSSFVVDEVIWGLTTEATCEPLQRIRPVFDRITVTSRSFLLEATPLQTPDSDSLNEAVPRVRALYALDQATPDLVAWRFLP